jgi:hypothetical protein
MANLPRARGTPKVVAGMARGTTAVVALAVALVAAGPPGCAAARVATRPAMRAAPPGCAAARSSRIAMLTEIPQVVYGPEIHPEQLAAMAVVSALTAVGYVLWDRVLVPQKRLELSLSKRKGEVKALLDELEQAPSESSERALERWFFTDWLDARSGPQKKKAAIPFLPKAKFNSGDNPVIGAVAAIMAIGILSSSVKEVFHLISQHGQ